MLGGPLLFHCHTEEKGLLKIWFYVLLLGNADFELKVGTIAPKKFIARLRKEKVEFDNYMQQVAVIAIYYNINTINSIDTINTININIINTINNVQINFKNNSSNRLIPSKEKDFVPFQHQT